MNGRYVLSLAGRGKGRVYVVTGTVDGQYVQICDGLTRKQSKPKLKKLKHLRLLDGYAELPCTDRRLAEQTSEKMRELNLS